MTVSPPQQVCLLRKTIPIPTGQGTGQLVKGELVTVINRHGDECTISLLLDSSQVYSCPDKNLKLVSYEIVKFLLPVIPCSRRYEAFSKMDKELITMPQGTHVNIHRGHQGAHIVGELKYRGEIKDRLGVWFGLKLVVGIGGDGDGSIKGVYYMTQCPPNSVVFATIDELSVKKINSSQESTLTLLSNCDIKEKPQYKVSSKTLPTRTKRSETKSTPMICPYTERDEVIVLKKKLPAEAGVVRAIFQDAKKQWMLGVELENPVGDSNGVYKGRQMFSCAPKYGVFCDTTEAMPKHYYELPRTSSPSIPGSLDSPPPPSYNDVYNNPVQQQHLPNSKSPRLGAKGDFEHAFRLRSPSPSAISPSDRVRATTPTYNDRVKPSTPTYNDIRVKPPTPTYSDVVRPPTPTYSDHVKPPTPTYSDLVKPSTPTYSDKVRPTTPTYSQIISSDPGVSQLVGTSTDTPSTPSTPNTATTPNTLNTANTPNTANTVDLPSNSYRNYSPEPIEPKEIDHSLEVGSMVQVTKSGTVLYGVIRWIGSLPGKKLPCAGLELEEDIRPPGNNGTYDGTRYFHCPPFRGHFCYLHDCGKDGRFQELPEQETSVSHYFGPKGSAVIEGQVEPPKVISQRYVGRNCGIQGNKNSCYLDASLYAMFAFNDSMDYILSSPLDGTINQTIQQKLRETVVNPLRSEGYVGAEHMRHLRDLLSKGCTLPGLQDQEKEPEELLNVLFNEIFSITPLLSFRDEGTGDVTNVNLCQIVLDRDHDKVMPHTQHLLTRYLVSQNLYFHSQPRLLLLQVPRSGKDFKLYDTVLPSTVLELGGLCGGVWGNCYICSKKSLMKCSQCYISQEFKAEYSAVPYCESCCTLVHSHPDRQNHTPQNATNPARSIKMVLSAVLCIHTSHYVTYCRAPPFTPHSPGSGSTTSGSGSGSGTSEPENWVFFDSMSDRMGGLGGYNVPNVQECPDLEFWLNNPERLLQDKNSAPDSVKRLISDALLCFYVREG